MEKSEEKFKNDVIGHIRRGEYAKASSLLDYKIQSLIIKSIVEKELSNNKKSKGVEE